jgi:hypothetical protein
VIVAEQSMLAHRLTMKLAHHCKFTVLLFCDRSELGIMQISPFHLLHIV